MGHEHTRQHLEMQTRTYRHPETGSRIDLIGVVHFAEQQFYDKIQEFIDEREESGAVIHFESTKRATPEEYKAAPPQVRRNIRRIRKIHKGFKFMSDRLGLVPQKQGLNYRQTWENHDATELDIAARLNPRSLGKYALLSRGLSVVGNVLPPDMMHYFLVAGLSTPDEELSKPKRPTKKYIEDKNAVIRTYRNEVALAAVDAQLGREPGSDIALLWGGGHVADLGKGLEARHYRQTEDWSLVAIHENDFFEKYLKTDD
jgi:hypothetical protein